MTAPEPSLPSVRWSGWSHRGKFRKTNEDAFLAVTFDAQQVQYLGKEGSASLAQGDCLFAVSDGMGGANAGEFASRIAVEKIAAMMTRSGRLAAAGFHRGETDFLAELIDSIHDEMVRQGQAYDECAGMGATLTLSWITPERVYFAHVGDSRLFFLPVSGGIRQVTEDHTHVGWLLREGRISKYEAKNHPRRHQLQQVLGGRQVRPVPQVGTIDFEPGDRLVLCTDGISDGLSDRSIQSLVREPPPRLAEQPLSHRLIHEAMDLSGRDNLTAIVVELGTA